MSFFLLQHELPHLHLSFYSILLFGKLLFISWYSNQVLFFLWSLTAPWIVGRVWIAWIDKKGYFKQEKPYNQRQVMNIYIMWDKGGWGRVKEGIRLANSASDDNIGKTIAAAGEVVMSIFFLHRVSGKHLSLKECYYIASVTWCWDGQYFVSWKTGLSNSSLSCGHFFWSVMGW